MGQAFYAGSSSSHKPGDGGQLSQCHTEMNWKGLEFTPLSSHSSAGLPGCWSNRIKLVIIKHLLSARHFTVFGV